MHNLFQEIQAIVWTWWLCVWSIVFTPISSFGQAIIWMIGIFKYQYHDLDQVLKITGLTLIYWKSTKIFKVQKVVLSELSLQGQRDSMDTCTLEYVSSHNYILRWESCCCCWCCNQRWCLKTPHPSMWSLTTRIFEYFRPVYNQPNNSLRSTINWRRYLIKKRMLFEQSKLLFKEPKLDNVFDNRMKIHHL